MPAGLGRADLHRQSLEDAVATTAPVSLHGTDACGSGATALTSSTTTATFDTLATTTATTRKFHKGHYIALMSYSDSTKTMAASMKPGVKGFMKRYRWNELEPSQGNYNFSEIQADLTWCAANGMQLIVMVEDKTFSSDAGNPAPAYLAKYAARNTSRRLHDDPLEPDRGDALQGARDGTGQVRFQQGIRGDRHTGDRAEPVGHGAQGERLHAREVSRRLHQHPDGGRRLRCRLPACSGS